MESNLDVWAIQYYPEELLNALNQIKNGMNIIYSNCTCSLTIGNETIESRQFDTVLYNEESDILILLMRGGKATKEDIIKYLEENNKQYAEVTFDSSLLNEYQDGDNIPEIWFAREQYVLDDALLDSKNKNLTHLEIYPLIDGNIKLGYIANVADNYSIDGRLFKGLLKIDDKLILIINQINNVDEKGSSRNITINDIINVVEKYGFTYSLKDDEPNLYIDNFSSKIRNK